MWSATACALLGVYLLCMTTAQAAPAQTQPDYTLYNTRYDNLWTRHVSSLQHSHIIVCPCQKP